jgi:hypothetical protein
MRGSPTADDRGWKPLHLCYTWENPFRWGEDNQIDAKVRARLVIVHLALRNAISNRFHHSSFFAGEAVEAAGQIVVKGGRLVELYPHSGHYRPQDKHLLYMINFFSSHSVKLDYTVDAQRLLKIPRILEGETGPFSPQSLLICVLW